MSSTASNGDPIFSIGPVAQKGKEFCMAAKSSNQADADIRGSVVREIDWDPEISSTDISVDAQDGVLTLTGFVRSYPEKTAAEKAAKRVYGVKAVANDIKVEPLSVTDPEIAKTAVFALEKNVNVPDDNIKITVKEGWITLEGRVDWQFQKNAAEAAVRNLAGVRGVTDVIEVKPTVSPTLVKTRIEEALRRSAEVDARRISVDAHDSTVRIWGNVRSWAEKQEAERAAWAAPGVSKVENLISVIP